MHCPKLNNLCVWSVHNLNHVTRITWQICSPLVCIVCLTRWSAIRTWPRRSWSTIATLRASQWLLIALWVHLTGPGQSRLKIIAMILTKREWERILYVITTSQHYYKMGLFGKIPLKCLSPPISVILLWLVSTCAACLHVTYFSGFWLMKKQPCNPNDVRLLIFTTVHLQAVFNSD